MSSLQTSTSRHENDGRGQLHDEVRGTVRRGRVLDSIAVAMLCMAALIGGLFIVAIKDAVFVLPVAARVVLLAVLMLGSIGIGTMLVLRPWRNRRYDRATGEQIDNAAQANHQPVTVGLTLNDSMDDDSLAIALLQRAETRASEVARTVKPNEAYPLRQLLGPTVWFVNAVGLWLLLAILLPSQTLGLAARVLLPWTDTPPFSLTVLEPKWEHYISSGGPSFTLLEVAPKGSMPDEVDWVLVDERGNETERFAMQKSGQDGFRYTLTPVGSPVDFRLEANGRQTRVYTIEPWPMDVAAAESIDHTTEDANEPDGTTEFDPEKIARRDLEANDDWQAVKAKLKGLLEELADAQAMAEGLDPADAEALEALSGRLAELTAEAKDLAGKLTAIQGDLPADAAALLDALTDALNGMQSAALPAPPSAQEGALSSDASATNWLSQAADAAKSDQQKIGQGIGPSDLPTGSGTASGGPGDGPAIRDPSTSGTYDESTASGKDGPLPDAVIRQVPPSYRTFVSTYFETLSNEPSP